ncbi:hypothetical protein [Streptomyces hirsutus]|uniref:hypothetical protein n=1 Tax=Streptomyces hirsutus TaxID=35620 RepID=UPI0036B5E24A
MRPSIESALRQSAELTRNHQLVKAVEVAEAAIRRADGSEHAEIQQWLTDHADDFVGRED